MTNKLTFWQRLSVGLSLFFINYFDNAKASKEALETQTNPKDKP